MSKGIPNPIELFYSYSYEDEDLRNRLDKHLIILKRQGLISGWYDRQITAGSHLAKESMGHLNKAQIILLLISPDFLASDYHYGIEVLRAMERHEAGEACVIPILLRAVDHKGAPFEKLSILPNNGIPVKQWSDLDEAFKDVAQDIRKVAINYLNEQSISALAVKSERALDRSSTSFLLCPYRGLSAFREEDAPFFFGREVFINQMIQSVQTKPLTALIGPSGSGKSSLVFAGLLHQLNREGNWLIASLRPFDHPFRSLATALAPLLRTQISETRLILETKKLAQSLDEREISLLDIMQRIKKKHNVSRFLLIIDQFEELYTLSEHNEDRQHFLDILLENVQAMSQLQTLNYGLVLTMRADFLGQALLYRPFADALQHADLKLSSMNSQELEDAIRKPAGLLNINIEDGLTERILDAISKEPGELPLLQFTLTQLWNKQQGSKLTHEAYNEIGGVLHSLAAYADDVYFGLDEKEKQQARQIFTQLVYPGYGMEDTRRIATRSQLGEESWSLVMDLSDSRLVITNRDELTGEETAEVIHEALIRGWDILREWMKEDREFRLWQERLRARVSDWQRSNKSSSELVRGATLNEAESWLEKRNSELSELEQEFILASQDQQQLEIQRTLLLQEMISIAFPLDVIPSKLAEIVYRFVKAVVPISSMLLTFYDRDTKKIYDVFAIDHGRRIEELYEYPVIEQPEARPIWWKVTQEQQCIVLLYPTQDEPGFIRQHAELLKGTWGDQSNDKSFLLLPMKVFTRVVGSLSLTSLRSNAFSREDILILERIVQLSTFSIEIAKLYDRSRRSVKRGRQREESQVVMNSALLDVSSVLNMVELLYNFVETSAKLVQAELCTFFQLAKDGEELVAQAIYDSTGKWNDAIHASSRTQHDDLIKMIRLPFQNSILGKLVEADFFFYLDRNLIDELAQISPEGGAVFLRETRSHKTLMIPVRYLSELVGVLAVHTPWQDRVFRPEEVSMLLAISGKAASAIRNAQLSEETREANAELQRMDKLKD